MRVFCELRVVPLLSFWSVLGEFLHSAGIFRIWLTNIFYIHRPQIPDRSPEWHENYSLFTFVLLIRNDILVSVLAVIARNVMTKQSRWIFFFFGLLHFVRNDMKTIHFSLIGIWSSEYFYSLLLIPFPFRIIRVVAGVTSRSTLRAGFAFAHTAPYRKSD